VTSGWLEPERIARSTRKSRFHSSIPAQTDGSTRLTKRNSDRHDQLFSSNRRGSEGNGGLRLWTSWDDTIGEIMKARRRNLSRFSS
jgi:hypothetical protein